MTLGLYIKELLSQYPTDFQGVIDVDTEDAKIIYFELRPYKNESIIRCNLEKVIKTEANIQLVIYTRIRNFHTGILTIDLSDYYCNIELL